MRSVIRVAVVLVLALGVRAMAQAAPAKPDSTRPPSANFLRGRQIFMEHCAMCHGDNGTGDGDFSVRVRMSAGRNPANLTDRGNLQRLGRAGVRRVIAQGGAHTGRSNFMPAWGEELTSGEIDDVANFVWRLPEATPGVGSLAKRDFAQTSTGAADEGKRLFLHHCAACHGQTGHGDGRLAANLKAKHNVQPRNLTDSLYVSHKTDKDLFMTIRLGGGHMGKSPYMPVWAGYLTPEQTKSLVSYIRVLSRTAPQP
jgi:mono/diheme cytochrome c family protein